MSSWFTILGVAVIAGSLAGCDKLLEVDLPDAVTDEALLDPSGAEVQVSSVVGQVECAYSDFIIQSLGFADGLIRVAGTGSGFSEYEHAPDTGSCDVEDVEFNWFVPFNVARAMGYDVYDRISGWTVEEVPDREELLATTALYTAVSLDVFGEHFCDLSLDGGPLMGPDEILQTAEEWVDTSLGHVSNTGDFALPNGITSSIETFAYGLRARIRWARGDLTGAAQDAAMIPEGYVAWVTRESGLQRRNHPYIHHTSVGFGLLNGPVDYWSGPPNPVTGEEWPTVIPFTGYLNLAIDATTGRAVDDAGYPITEDQVGTVPDTRVTHRDQQVLQEFGPVPTKYTSETEDIPLVNWKEIWLIRAEIEGGQTAIDLVNDLRQADGLPEVTYADPGDVDQIENMIIEERRRALFSEGRFWSTKIQNTDKLWFPRAVGQTPTSGAYPLRGGVRMVMPEQEYRLNSNFTLADRGTGCVDAEAPTIF